MSTNNPDPPGAFHLNPPTMPLPAVVAADPQDFPTQSPVQYTQTGITQIINAEDAAKYHTTATLTPLATTGLTQILNAEDAAKYHTTATLSQFSSAPNAEDRPRSPLPFSEQGDRTPTRTPTRPPSLSINTALAFATTNYSTQDLNAQTPSDIGQVREWEHEVNSSPSSPIDVPGTTDGLEAPTRLDDFLQYVRLRPLPGDAIVNTGTPDTETLEELTQITRELKHELNDAVMGYGYYYQGPDFRLRRDSDLPLQNAELNAAVRTVLVCLDSGLATKGRLGLTHTSWFRIAHTLMGAIIRGAIRSNSFRKLGRDSLNGTGDHIIIKSGLIRPLTHLQMLQAMAEQLQRLCDTRPEYEQNHITNVYDSVIRHVGVVIETAVRADAEATLPYQKECPALFLRKIQL
ncbi:hypothetical protein EI94DRAFT_1754641 [Lactarius quietus]|nr:hypothetical protein EI94DRAFT_1754641 [Lactarius quietus]